MQRADSLEHTDTCYMLEDDVEEGATPPAPGEKLLGLGAQKAWADAFWKPTLSLILGKTEGKRRRGRQRMKWLDSITDSMDMSLSKLLEIVKVSEVWCAAVHGVAKCWTWLSDWTTTMNKIWNSVIAAQYIGVQITHLLSTYTAKLYRVAETIMMNNLLWAKSSYSFSR